MRQYLIYYKRGTSKQWGTLEPHVSVKLYDRPEVHAGIAVLRDNPVFEAICIRVGDELFNVVTLEQEALAPRAFTFEGSTT